VLVFETGLPTRYYFDRTDVAFEHIVPTATQTAAVQRRHQRLLVGAHR